MSQITIQCRLFADETARQYLWRLMAERNTPLVNELLNAIAHHQDFSNWQSKGKLPSSEVTKLTKSLKTDSRFSGQPAKFLIGCQSDPTDDESKAAFRKQLYRTYDKTDNTLTRCAIAYLLKNRCQIPTGEEDTDRFLKYRRKIDRQIERLRQQLESRLPKGRDLTGARWLECLDLATNQAPVDNSEAFGWQSQLLERTQLVPFPIVLESNMDLMWFLTDTGKIGLHIGGISEYEFTIGCGQRQLHYFQRFLADYQAMLASKKQHTSSLFLLRSAKLIWQPNSDKGKPWNVHQLYLSCTLDTRLLTVEGTELVRKEVGVVTLKKLEVMQAKTDRTSSQDNYIKPTFR